LIVKIILLRLPKDRKPNARINRRAIKVNDKRLAHCESG